MSFNKKNNKYAAYIMVGGKQKWLGNYVNFDDAVNARMLAEEKYYREYSFNNSNKRTINNEISN